MDCGGVFVKYVLFIFNILFVVCGILLIIFGSLMLSNVGNISDITNTNSVAIAVLVLGCLIFVISFFGCCGAIREHACCTMTYSVFMLILFILQLALVAIIWVKRQDLLNAMDDAMATIWKERKSDQKVMNGLQIGFNCCGVNGFSDYIQAGEDVPKSCCGASATSCSVVDAMTRPGCSKAFGKYWEKNIDIVRYAGLGIAGIELIAFIFACCLANQVRNDHRRANY